MPTDLEFSQTSIDFFSLLFTDDHLFAVVIQGKNFNATLSRKYLYSSDAHNLSFTVPISKYMPDEFLSLVFTPLKTNIKEMEHCYNYNKQYECPFLNSMYYKESSHKVNEKSPYQQLGTAQSVVFEVDMVGFQSKFMTYRASLRQNQVGNERHTVKICTNNMRDFVAEHL